MVWRDSLSVNGGHFIDSKVIERRTEFTYTVCMEAKDKQLADFCASHEIEILYVFGSRTGETREWLEGSRGRFSVSGADMDIGVKTPPGKQLPIREKSSIAVHLEDFFGVSRVDLVVLSESDPFLAANIIRGERLFCVDPHAADEYELYILRRAGDLAPLERERLSLLQGR